MARKTNKENISQNCPCGGGNFDHCCGRFLEGKEEAPTALLLMRSRYTAYVLQDKAYLKHSWHIDTVPHDIEQLFNQSPPQWLGLTIKDYQLIDPHHAEVEFIARYKIGGRAYRLQERSRFLYIDEKRWVYVDGDTNRE